MNKETTITLSLLLFSSLIMLIIAATTNMNFKLISNAMAIEDSIPYSEQYTQQIYSNNNNDDDIYNDNSRNHYYSKQSQNEQLERYQSNDNNKYGHNNNNDDTYYDEGYDYDYGYTPKNPILDSLQAEGTFFVSDAGESHGGFEFTAEYTAEFDVTNGIGTLTLTQIIGLGDPLEKHVYSITDLKIDKNEKITMNIDSNPVKLIFVESDEIWNHQFDNHYIASWGGFAPENEIKGVISPTIFPGLPDFWYIELRIPAVY